MKAAAQKIQATEPLARNSAADSSPREPGSILDDVSFPEDFRHFSIPQLSELAQAVRGRMIKAVARTGGHLGAGLGVVELTVALHAVFNTPHDRLIWDVGHQCYPHKILTGRKDRIDTLRQGGGLAGFTKRAESPYDPFGAGHSSTSISAGLGMAVAAGLDGLTRNVICVIGDGAMSAGMAFEAMNNAGDMNARLIVILNDNRMSIAPPVGAMSRYLTRLYSSRPYIGAREAAKKILGHMPPPVRRAARKMEESARAAMGHGTLFEEMGFYYIGPVDGHKMEDLVPVLRNVRNTPGDGPVLIHVITEKGKGYSPAERAGDKMHGVSKFDVVSGEQHGKNSAKAAPAYTDVFADSLIDAARKDPKIVGITAAMPGGTGMDAFARAFPERMFDVGIAEQHAVTFAAGLAAEGYKPFTAIYSTFLQRAYDQLIHDVAIQNLPVRFAIDRAGLVGADGQTHAGSFDTAYLACIPHMVLMAAGDEGDLARMVATAAAYDDGPIAFRYPRGCGTGAQILSAPERLPLPLGKGRILREGADLAILSYGGRLAEALMAADMLETGGRIRVTVADARFAKPLDTDLLAQLADQHKALICIEEGSIGGFGSAVLDALMRGNRLDGRVKIRTMVLPDRFQCQDRPEAQYRDAGLDARGIVEQAAGLLSL